MEVDCKHNSKPHYYKTYCPRSAAGKDSIALHVIKFVQITGFLKIQ